MDDQATQAGFRHMDESTAEDWAIIGTHFVPFAGQLAERVLTHLKILDGDYGGFPIDRLQHSLQTATRAHRGGAKVTLPSTTTGRPAKSDGSRIDAMTVSHGSPSAADIALIAEVLPVPGAPHSRTGTRAATATPSASTVVWVADTYRS